MRVLIQRVKNASVSVDGRIVGAIGHGLVILVGIRVGDTEAEAQWLASKIATLRIFDDEAGKLNRSVLDIKGSVLVVSQFTLYGDARKGRRPSYDQAAPPEVAEPLIRRLVELLEAQGVPVQTGIFRAHMLVEIHNDGPVTILLEQDARGRMQEAGCRKQDAGSRMQEAGCNQCDERPLPLASCLLPLASCLLTCEDTMLLKDLNWMDVEEYLKHDDRIILVTGSCEQHGYLSLLSDVRQPMAIATAAAERENVLVAPPLNFGVSSYFAAYPGTISLSAEMFNRVVCELVSELHRQGFRRVLVLNGHGGNAGMDFALRELVNLLPGLRLAIHHWWKGPAAVQFYADNKLMPAHANWSENFPFTRVADVPEGDKPATGSTPYLPADEVRARLGDGSFGGPYQVSDDIMQRLFEVAVTEVVQLLRNLQALE